MTTHEVNFDGLVGPTHNYAGLSVGNLASMEHRGAASNPRAAALQGLAKMQRLAALGVKQAVLPPHERPHIPTLRRLGFGGSDADVLAGAARHAPELLIACSSASNMWTANAATVAQSADTLDGRVHLIPANLVSKFHRSIEPPQTTRTLRAIFNDEARFAVHPPVPHAQGLGDEGAANHTRLAVAHGRPGLHVLVYGHAAFASNAPSRGTTRFPSRQAFEASMAIARALAIAPRTEFVLQNPEAIDAGVFHNDVISVGNENVLLYHEHAYVDTVAVVNRLRERFRSENGGLELVDVQVPAADVSLADAVASYLFNSQLVTLRANHMALIAPAECGENPRVRAFIEGWLSRNTPLREVHYVDLRESMQNGGGPACLRLRVSLTDDELAAIAPGVLCDGPRFEQLIAWVKRNYRESLKPGELADPALLEESRRALDELTQLLGVGSLYPFQRDGSDA